MTPRLLSFAEWESNTKREERSGLKYGELAEVYVIYQKLAEKKYTYADTYKTYVEWFTAKYGSKLYKALE